jgi:hypothetical protein
MPDITPEYISKIFSVRDAESPTPVEVRRARYRIKKKILSGTFAGMVHIDITDFPVEVGFTCQAWYYGPAYEVLSCTKIS